MNRLNNELELLFLYVNDREQQIEIYEDFLANLEHELPGFPAQYRQIIDYVIRNYILQEYYRDLRVNIYLYIYVNIFSLRDKCSIIHISFGLFYIIEGGWGLYSMVPQFTQLKIIIKHMERWLHTPHIQRNFPTIFFLLEFIFVFNAEVHTAMIANAMK